MKMTTESKSSQYAKSAKKKFSTDSKEEKLILRLKLDKRKSEISERKEERLLDSNTIKQIYEDFDEIWFAIERLKKNLIR